MHRLAAFALLLPLTANAASAPPADTRFEDRQPTAYHFWPFDEGAGTTATSAAGTIGPQITLDFYGNVGWADGVGITIAPEGPTDAKTWVNSTDSVSDYVSFASDGAFTVEFTILPNKTTAAVLDETGSAYSPVIWGIMADPTFVFDYYSEYTQTNGRFSSLAALQSDNFYDTNAGYTDNALDFGGTGQFPSIAMHMPGALRVGDVPTFQRTVQNSTLIGATKPARPVHHLYIVEVDENTTPFDSESRARLYVDGVLVFNETTSGDPRLMGLISNPYLDGSVELDLVMNLGRHAGTPAGGQYDGVISMLALYDRALNASEIAAAAATPYAPFPSECVASDYIETGLNTTVTLTLPVNAPYGDAAFPYLVVPKITTFPPELTIVDAATGNPINASSPYATTPQIQTTRAGNFTGNATIGFVTATGEGDGATECFVTQQGLEPNSPVTLFLEDSGAVDAIVATPGDKITVQVGAIDPDVGAATSTYLVSVIMGAGLTALNGTEPRPDLELRIYTVVGIAALDALLDEVVLVPLLGMDDLPVPITDLPVLITVCHSQNGQKIIDQLAFAIAIDGVGGSAMPPPEVDDDDDEVIIQVISAGIWVALGVVGALTVVSLYTSSQTAEKNGYGLLKGKR